MTNWTFKKHPKNGKMMVFRTEEGQPKVLVGEIVAQPDDKLSLIHSALTEVAQYFKPGDVIITPDGKCISGGYYGEINN